MPRRFERSADEQYDVLQCAIEETVNAADMGDYERAVAAVRSQEVQAVTLFALELHELRQLFSSRMGEFGR